MLASSMSLISDKYYLAKSVLDERFCPGVSWICDSLEVSL